jgi:hypothetical protein
MRSRDLYVTPGSAGFGEVGDRVIRTRVEVGYWCDGYGLSQRHAPGRDIDGPRGHLREGADQPPSIYERLDETTRYRNPACVTLRRAARTQVAGCLDIIFDVTKSIIGAASSRANSIQRRSRFMSSHRGSSGA